MEDLIINMQKADFCYPLKSAILQFLQHIYLDIEKEIGEDFINLVWKLIRLIVIDMEKFVEIMQRQKRAGSKMVRKTIDDGRETSIMESQFDGFTKDNIGHRQSILEDFSSVEVDVNTNFEFVTNFGRFPVSELMQEYFFDSIFPTLEIFFSLRLPIKRDDKEWVRKLLKLSFMSIAYKSKPHHEKRFQKLLAEVRNFPALSELQAEWGLD